MSTKKGEETKEKIMRATVDFIVRDGIENVGINKIIKEASVSKGSFYHYFSSMDELIKEVAIYTFERCLQHMPLSQTSSVEDIVKNLGKHIFTSVRNHNRDYYLLFLFISKSFVDEELRQSFRTIFSNIVYNNTVAQQIMHENPEIDAEQLQTLDMLALGFIVHCHLLQDEEQLLPVWNRMTSHLFNKEG
ncbi:TetR/AcrR family transcriptional regulator [Pontibacillus yanchengensis]|uniref:HTH tetR-type domain-containing protein n=1 Tax=Pontibacillus yanchengensis Y32 TaxID=1385514 RepID=A0A0A2TE80_9BACI|nr:TetR/AcrR family transcriptional regulator [Pontibacillus yanchengensis]KGP72356.1 hypothetical protein N782_12940 [Pontibacillus yanchengensis Y32]